MSVKIVRAHNGKYRMNVEVEYRKNWGDLRVFAIGREYQFQVKDYMPRYRILTVISPIDGDLYSVFCSELASVMEAKNRN